MVCIYTYKGVIYTDVDILKSKIGSEKKVSQSQMYDILIAAESQLMEKLPLLLKRTGHTSLENLMLDYGFTMDSKEGKIKLLMELAARWAETLVDKPQPTWWKQLINSMTEWIKKFVGKTLTENEVNELVGQFVKYGTDSTTTKSFNQFQQSLNNPNTNPVLLGTTSPDVILPIGTSGSGKSTFIKSLPQENLIIIEPDAMRVEFTGDMNNKSKDKEIYEEAAKRAIQAIKQGKQVVFDTTNLTKEKRLPFIEAIKKEIPTANIQYKLMELNPELAKQRIKAQIERGENRANVSEETIDRHAESYKQMLEDIKNEPITNFDYKEEQLKKFNELQELISNNEFIQGAKLAFESSDLKDYGTLENYIDYIARISLGIIRNPTSGEFNNSVVKDIVYHGASKDFQGFIKNKKIIPKGKTKGGIWFTDFANADWVYKEEEGKVIAALINLKNPIEYKTERYFDDEYGDYLNSKPLKEGQWKDVQQLIDNKQGDGLLLDIFDATTSGDIGEFTKQQVVFEPEQIHILSSKQDIEGFKDFVTQSSTTIKPEVQKLFNSNPELVNKVYEILGFKTAKQYSTSISSTIYELIPNITEEKINEIYENYVSLMNKTRVNKEITKEVFKNLLKQYQVFNYKNTYIFGHYDSQNGVFITRINSSPSSKELLAEALPKLVSQGIHFASFVPKDVADKYQRSGYSVSTHGFDYNFKGENMIKYLAVSDPNIALKLFSKNVDEVSSNEIEDFNKKQQLKYIPVEIKGDLIETAGKESSKIFETYLNQFGIIVKDIDIIKKQLGIDELGFADILSKIAYVKDKKDLPPIAGEFITYMMQYNPLVVTIIDELIQTNAINIPKKSYRVNQDGNKIYNYKTLDKTEFYKYIGNLIAKDLQNKLEGNYQKSLVDKIKELIKVFYNYLTNTEIDKINVNIGIITNNILQQNKKLITASLYKPGAFGKPTKQVSLKEAMDSDKFGASIINKLSKQGFILTGSTSLGEQGTIQRPNENLLHDIDWVSPFDKKQTETLFKEIYPNAIKIRDIYNDEFVTDTWLIAPEGYEIINIQKTDGYNIIISYDVIDHNNKIVGNYRLQKQKENNQNEEIVTGIEAKIIDFFSYDKYNQLDPFEKDGIKLTNWKEIFKAKLQFARYKDIWDYNRFIPNDNIYEITPDQKQQALQLYSQYLDTGRRDIEGFKDFVNNKKNEVVKESNNQSLQDGLQWLKQIMPDVEPLLVDGLIDNIANGKYDILNDVITLSEDFANKGVVKEEVFHRWWEKMIPNQTEVENILNEKIENREITKDCKNDFKATQGLTTTTNGTNWSIIEDLKGNSHKLGGIDLTIGEDGISFKNNNSDIKAQDGLLIPSDKNKTNNYDNEFLNNWYKNRQIQDSYIQEAFELDKPEYLKKIEKYPEVKVVDKIDNNPNITGQYNKEKNEIYLTKDAEDSTLTHEQNHYINDFESYMKTIHDNIVKNEIKPIEDITHNGVKKNYDYLSNSNEIHSRIMILREKAGFKPNEFINEEKLDNYLKTYKGDVSNIEDLLYLMKDKKSLLNMLNYMAYNSNNNTENNA